MIRAQSVSTNSRIELVWICAGRMDIDQAKESGKKCKVKVQCVGTYIGAKASGTRWRMVPV